MFCYTYSLSSLLSPTNASFASSMAQEISLFRKSLQEKSFLVKKPCNIVMPAAHGKVGKRTHWCTGLLWCSGTVSPGRSQIFYKAKFVRRWIFHFRDARENSIVQHQCRRQNHKQILQYNLLMWDWRKGPVWRALVMWWTMYQGLGEAPEASWFT